MTTNYFELPPAGKNPPYGPGDYAGCVVAVCADFIEAYTGTKVTDLSALGKSMGQRHRNVDPACRHGIAPTAWCSYCLYLECFARGMPVAYQQLTWAQIETLAAAGKYVALAGNYGKIGYVSPSSYSSTVPAHGRSDAFTGSHAVALIGEEAGRFKVLDPDFGNQRGTPPYSLLDKQQLFDFWSALEYAVCYATRAPGGTGGASPTRNAVVIHPTALWNPVTQKWRYAVKVGTKLSVRTAEYHFDGKACQPVNGPAPYGGYFVPIANVRYVP